MKRSVKILWLVIGIIFAAGLILAAVGYSMGAKMHLVFDWNGVHVVDSNADIISDQQDLSQFTSIELDTTTASVELVPSDHYGIETHCQPQNGNITWEITDGNLIVTQQGASQGSALNWNFSFSQMNQEYYWGNVKIYYPEEATFQSVSTHTSGTVSISGLHADTLKNSGDSTDITVNDTTIKEWINDLTEGDIEATDVVANKIDLSMAEGDVTLHSVQADELNVNGNETTINLSSCSVEKVKSTVSQGDITLLSCNTKGLQLFTYEGDINISGNIQGETSLKTAEGDIVISPALNQSSYQYELKTLDGSVLLDGTEQQTYLTYHNSTAENQIIANTSSGDIELSF